MRLSKITIRGCRGYNGEQSISLDNNLIVIYGLNGSGKSSFTEALEWLFFGEISRQRLSRCRSEYQYEEYLKNLFYSDPQNPFVEVEGSLQGTPIKLRKEITKDGEKFFVDGVEVPNFKSLKLNLEPFFRPMLAQTEIKALVDSEQKDRWEQLSSILGQDVLSKLREDLQELKTAKKDDTYKKDELKWQGTLGDIQSSKSITTLYKPVQELSEENTLKELSSVFGETTTSLSDAAKKIKAKLTALLNTELGRRIAELTYKTSTEVDAYSVAITEPFERLDRCSEKIAALGHDHKQLDFLTQGATLAKPPECPFCLQSTLSETRLGEIQKTLGDGKETQALRQELESIKQELRDAIKSCSEKTSGLFPSQQELKIIAQKLQDAGQDLLGSEVQELEKEIASFTTTVCKEIKEHIVKEVTYIEDKHFHKTGLVTSLPALKDTILGIATKQAEVNSTWEGLKLKIAKVMPTSGDVDQEEIKKWLILEKVVAFFVSGEAFIRKTHLLNLIETTQKKLETFEKSEVARLLKEHEAEIKTYYEKLNKGDRVQFLGIEVRPGVRRQAKLTAEAYGRPVNPVTFFSEAHTNSLALSIYFPQRVDRNSTWETVVLDDPVQSMDANHSHALLDILGGIMKKKQVIVLTHSKTFYRSLTTRFAHLQPLAYHFFNNDDKGPSIKLDKGETIGFLALVEENCAKGSPRELTVASQCLRQAMEAICMEVMLEKGIGFNKVQKHQNDGFATLFSEAEAAGLPPDDIGKMKSLLDMSHADSHAWSISDTSQGALRKGASYIQDIYDRFIK